MRKTILFFSLLLIVVFFLSSTIFAVEKKEEMELVVIMYGEANQGTWEPAAHEALLKVQKEVPFNLSLNENTSTQDAERIIRNWAAHGADVIFAHSAVYIDNLITVAKNFENVYFIGESRGPVTLNQTDYPYRSENTPLNFVIAGDTPGEGNYLAGYAAALMSKNGMLGILQPFESPGLNDYSNSFYFGAKEAKPDIEVKIVYLGDYIAPAETRDAVKSLAQQGCDVIFTELDDNSSIVECAAQGIYCIPMYIDKSSFDPKTVLTSVVMDWSGPLGGAIEAVYNNNFAEYRKESYFRPLTVKDHSLYLGKWAPTVPDEVKKAVAEVEAKIIDGTLKVEKVEESIINK